ncbi:hypothetical protein V7182_23130 [Neobacillus drentensis]|uniref:hypothetical protein n=1 Tax=Neobacillus drentensis TaxID=220684 RepID=UPI002FFE1B48
MKEIKTKIGDHLIHIICEAEKSRSFFEKNFFVDYISEHQHPDLIIKVKDGYGVQFKNYDVEISKVEDNIYYRRADYLIQVDSKYKLAIISVHDELALKHALTNLYSSFIVHHNWGLLIHSSCVIEKEKAHIFAGKSGAGKSTAAKLSIPKEILSDEATLVKITSDEVSVYNSPFRSEIKAEQLERSVKLESIQILYQALQNSRIKISMSDALLHIIDKVFFWPHTQIETKTIMKLLTLLVKNTPVYELYFQKDDTFWKLIS